MAAGEAKAEEAAAVEIKQPPKATTLTLQIDDDDDAANLQYHHLIKTPFFKSSSRRRRSDTWVISLAILFHLIAFVATMTVNDCSTNSHGDCAVKSLGRFSFQPLSENPLLGPSASTLDKMGALRRTLLARHQTWHIFLSPLLHAGVVHLLINLVCIIFIGIYLEQEFGPWRVGIIYVLSAFFGTMVTSFFVQDSTVVSSSCPLFGLLGATLSALVRNWKFYSSKVAALSILLFVFTCNFVLGLLPYVDNYSNIGGLVAGILLGFVLLFGPQHRQVSQRTGRFYRYIARCPFNLKEKLDRPVLRSVSLVVFVLLFVGFLVAALKGINVSQHCRCCRYIDCIPSARWSCKDVTSSCEIMVGEKELTLTCLENGNFRVVPYTNISWARMQDLCTLICS